MDYNYLFKGNLKKELVASGLLASLIQSVPDFRSFILQLIGIPTTEKINVTVEKDNVDIRIDMNSTIIIVENKINAESYVEGQLTDYYNNTLKEQEAMVKNIIAIYLTPNQIGKSEIDSINNMIDPLRKNKDKAIHLSWECIFDYPQDDGSDQDSRNARRVVDAIRQAVATERNRRVTIRTVVERARARLISESIWTNISQSGGKLQMNDNYLNFNTNAEFTEEDGYKFGIHVSISEKGTNIPEIADWWKGVIQCPTLTVGALGMFGRWGNEGNKKFSQDYPFGVTEQQLEDHIVTVWREGVAFMNSIRHYHQQ